MCQSKKDGGLRCAAHLKQAMVKLQAEETAYFAEKQKEFLINEPDVANDPKVKESIERRIEAIKASPEFRNFKPVTFKDVEVAHNAAMQAKEIRDEEKSAGYELSVSFKSIGKVFKGLKKGNADEISPTEKTLSLIRERCTGKTAKDPEGAVKSYYFRWQALDEMQNANQRYDDNPSDKNRVRKDYADEMYVRAAQNATTYNLSPAYRGDYQTLKYELDKQNPGISVYQYNYEHSVENFRKTKEAYESSADTSNEHAQKFEQAVEQARIGAITEAGPYTKHAERFNKEIYAKDPQSLARKAEMASLTDDYQLTRSYRNKLAENIKIYTAKGKTKEAEAAQIKLDLLTEKYNERKGRKEAVDTHMAEMAQ